jgi:transposase
VLAYFDHHTSFHHHTSNGPTEVINGRQEALHRNAVRFGNLTTTDSNPYCTAATSPT